MKLGWGNSDVESFGQRLRRLRMARGLNQRELAQKADMSNTYLSDIERGGKDSPTGKILERLADALGVSVDTLLGREAHPEGTNEDAAHIDPTKITAKLSRRELIIQAFPDLNPAFLELPPDEQERMIDEFERYLRFQVEDMKREAREGKSQRSD